MWSLKRKDANELTKHKETHRLRKQTYGEGEGIVRDFRKVMSTLLHLKWITNKDCVDHNKLWKILKEMGIPDHLICLLRNLYAGQEATVRTTWNNRLVPNRKRSSSRLYIVILFI